MLRRNPDIAYSAVGRVHNEPEAKQKDEDSLAMLRNQRVAFSLADSSETTAQRFTEAVVARLQEQPAAASAKQQSIRRLRAA